MDDLRKIPGIRNIYGRMFARSISALSKGKTGTATLIPYDEPQFRFAEEMLLRGNIGDVESGNGVLVDYVAAERNQWAVGDTITLTYSGKTTELPISGILSDTPFQAADGEWLVICPEATFTDLTGISDCWRRAGAASAPDILYPDDYRHLGRKLVTAAADLGHHCSGGAPDYGDRGDLSGEENRGDEYCQRGQHGVMVSCKIPKKYLTAAFPL